MAVFFKKHIINFFLFWLFIFFAGPADSASLNVLSDLDFGTITSSPYGDLVQINASAGPSSPLIISGGASSVSGGGSAVLRFVPDQAGQRINIDYPVSFNLSSGSNTMSISQITINSSTYFTTSDTSPINFYVGGVLEISNGQQPGAYSGNMTVTITINNP